MITQRPPPGQDRASASAAWPPIHTPNTSDSLGPDERKPSTAGIPTADTRSGVHSGFPNLTDAVIDRCQASGGRLGRFP